MKILARRARLLLLLALILSSYLVMGAGCSSDPNVEGAKLDIRNKDWDRALNNLEVALTSDPDNVEALVLKGNVLLEQASTEQDVDAHNALWEDMQAAYERASELTASDASANSDVVQQMRLAWFRESQRGNAAFNTGSQSQDKDAFAAAAAYFGNAASIMPDSANSHINMAYAVYNTGDPVKAIGPLEMAIEKGDMSTDTRNLLAQLYIIDGQNEKAVNFLEDAVTDFPDDADLRGRLFNAYIETGQVDRGINIAKESVDRDPNNPTYRYNYGTLLLQGNQFEEAAEQLEMASDMDPTNFNILQNLGAAFQNKAVALNEEAIELEDKTRAEGVTDEQREELEKQLETKLAERQELSERALPYLEKARNLIEEQGEDPTDICSTLFRLYGQLNDIDKAEEAATCAGIDLSGEN